MRQAEALCLDIMSLSFDASPVEMQNHILDEIIAIIVGMSMFRISVGTSMFETPILEGV